MFTPPAGYVLISTCVEIVKKRSAPDPDAPAPSSSMAAAAAITDKIFASGRASLCSEYFAPPGITDKERGNIIESAAFNCESTAGASKKLSTKNPEPCAPPVTGFQRIENHSVGDIFVKTRTTVNFANLSKQEKDAVKKGLAESPWEGGQADITQDLK